MKSIFSILLLVVIFASEAQAYIPRTQTIVKKMSANNGRREYKLVREVVIESREQKIKAREVWTVAHGDKMKVEVSSIDAPNPWNFTIHYGSKNRRTLAQNEEVKSFKKSPDFFEPLFHDRSSSSLLGRLVQYKFIPDWIKSTEAPSYDDGKTKMTPEPFVRLTPMEGSVNYTFGADNTAGGGNSHTTLWVEQDSFLIKKGKLRSNAEFVNSNFQSFPGGLKLPGEQIISWNDRVAKVKLLTVEKTRTKDKDWTLSAKKSGLIPSDPLVKEFYSRFR